MNSTDLPSGLVRTSRLGWLIAVLVAALVAAYVASRFVPNLRNAGFGYLRDSTGWDIAFSIVPYKSQDPYWWAFLVGIGNTVLAGSLAAVFATLLGFVVSLARLSPNALLSDLASLYVNVIRNIPVILQAMFWYTLILNMPPARQASSFLDVVYLSNRGLVVPWFDDPGSAVGLAGLLLAIALATVALVRDVRARPRSSADRMRHVIFAAALVAATGMLVALIIRYPNALKLELPIRSGLNFRGGLRIPPEFAALVTAITIYRSAFIAEIFRGGLSAVPKGQIDAARSLGLRPWVTMAKIRLPLALISIMPPLGSEYIIMMKITSIGIIVGFMDLFAVASMSSMMTGRALEVLATMVAFYLALNYSIVSGVNAINRRIRIRKAGDGD